MYSGRFAQAFAYAARLHTRPRRKGTNKPYIGHLLGVASIVIAYGGDEEMATAALLHDAVEDHARSAQKAYPHEQTAVRT